MPNNNRMYYAVYAVGVAKVGRNDYTAIHGLQSVGLSTRFNLESIFEIGQLEQYEIIENIPDVEVTLEKVLDGYPLIYHLATNGATSASLSGRSNVKSTVAVSYFTDTQDSASGTPLSQALISGVFPSSLTYSCQVQGPTTESVTLVGNNKSWLSSGFTFTGGFLNDDSPIGTGGVQRRENIVFGNLPNSSLLPTDIPNISSSGYAETESDGTFKAHISSIRVSTNLGREQLFELGRRGPYHRFVNFPTEVRTDIEIYCQKGDLKDAYEENESNLTDQTIILNFDESTRINCGTKNKLNSITETGGNAAQNGGNRSTTFSYTNFNSLTVTHANDPSGL